MEMRSDGKSEAEGVALMERLSDRPGGSTFSNIDSRLQIIDDLFSEIRYSLDLIKKYWGVKELDDGFLRLWFHSGHLGHRNRRNFEWRGLRSLGHNG